MATAPVLKTAEPQGLGGSTPPPSAKRNTSMAVFVYHEVYGWAKPGRTGCSNHWTGDGTEATAFPTIEAARQFITRAAKANGLKPDHCSITDGHGRPIRGVQ